jgi:FKBP-type peptidyl-prolyl cis-trans isomerase 2
MKIKYLLIICTLLISSLLITGCGGEAQVVQDGDQVSVHYILTLDDGTPVESSRDRGEPYSFVVGAGQSIEGFDNAVRGMKVGEIKTVTIPPEEAYGEYNDNLVVTLSRSQLEEGLEPYVGQQLIITLADGQMGYVTVVAITETDITVDANHELAGEALTFEIELVSIESGE